MTGPAQRVNGDDRENIAAAVGAAIASVYLGYELGLLAVLTTAARAALPFGAVTMPLLNKLRRQAAAKARPILADVGVPWDYQPVIPSPTPLPGITPSFERANLEPGMSAPELAAATGQITGPSLRDSFASISAQVYRAIPDLYQTAVIDATAETPGGL